MAQVKITLVKSLIGRQEKQILTAHSLGLKKIGDHKVAEKDHLLDGKIKVIAHLISFPRLKAAPARISERAEAPAAVTEKPADADIRVRTHAPAAV